ncbi:MAG: hypothetical protein FGF50_11300 [Candidatus Brockarchaeota archaeon]|nr:hypothetical protein [Candidatus Brockarchaeota archaeon]
MTNYYLGVMWMVEGSPEEIMKSEYEKELEKARQEIKERLGITSWFISEEFKFMLYKGIKYIPAIVYTAYELRRNYRFPEAGVFDTFEVFMRLTREQSRMLFDAYKKLSEKVKGMRTLSPNQYLRPEGEIWCEVENLRVATPPEVLESEEVQDEIKRLIEGSDLLSKDDPKDREVVRKHVVDTEPRYFRAKDEATKPLDIRIDNLIGYVNCKSRAWGEYFKAIHNIHHKYPDIKFYLYVYYS